MTLDITAVTTPPVLRDMPSGDDISIIGNDGMEPLVESLCALFNETCPQVRFRWSLRGSSTAIPALASAASILAPMSRAPWAGDMAAYRSAKGYAPSHIQIGYAGHGPREGAKTPPSVYVHADNPLTGLCMADLARTFCSGLPEGDLNLWGQLGLDGRWRGRRIHIYGLRDDGKYASGFRDAHLGARAYAGHYEALGSREEVIRAVADDPFGMGAIGWLETAKVSTNVRILPLARTRGGPFHTPSLDEVAAGAYPLSSPLSFYFDLAPGAALTPFLRAFLQLALSRKGQKIVAAQTHAREGYVPLCPADLAAQSEKLSHL